MGYGWGEMTALTSCWGLHVVALKGAPGPVDQASGRITLDQASITRYGWCRVREYSALILL